jgi:hypothetical protein
MGVTAIEYHGYKLFIQLVRLSFLFYGLSCSLSLLRFSLIWCHKEKRPQGGRPGGIEATPRRLAAS